MKTGVKVYSGCSGVQAVHEQIEAPERDVGPRVLHSEQRPGHLLPGHNIHLLGHSCTVHSGIIGQKKGYNQKISGIVYNCINSCHALIVQLLHVEVILD